MFQSRASILILILIGSIRFANGYIAVTQTLTWSQAEEYCVQTYDAHLASIHSLSENAELVALIGGIHGSWIGFNDIEVEGKWVWTDGSSNTFTHWYTRIRRRLEPSGVNGKGEPEDCVVILPVGHINRRDTYWNDGTCDSLNRFVCNDASSISPLTTTEHSTSALTTAEQSTSQSAQHSTTHLPTPESTSISALTTIEQSTSQSTQHSATHPKTSEQSTTPGTTAEHSTSPQHLTTTGHLTSAVATEILIDAVMFIVYILSGIIICVCFLPVQVYGTEIKMKHNNDYADDNEAPKANNFVIDTCGVTVVNNDEVIEGERREMNDERIITVHFANNTMNTFTFPISYDLDERGEDFYVELTSAIKEKLDYSDCACSIKLYEKVNGSNICIDDVDDLNDAISVNADSSEVHLYVDSETLTLQ